jgi:hypothetical protein
VLRRAGTGAPLCLRMVPTLGVMGTMLDTRRTDVPSIKVATRADKPLLSPGNEAVWAKINEEEAPQEAEFAATLSIPERLEFGQKLCDQAFDFYNAVNSGARGARRDPRS